ncbi:MAG: HAMP domain-containing protein [Spirochaetales bacterium]|nr:HAMP domain-containing protein [Spirochaetales bacterium]
MVKRVASTVSTALISILLIYLLLIVLILVFARQIISDVSLESPVSYYIVIPTAIILPLFLAVAIALNVIKALRERKRGKPGAGFKFRLMIFFAAVAIVSSIPQAIFSISFIEIAMSRWFSSPVAEGLEGGVDLVLEYNRENIEGLRVFASSPLLSPFYRELSKEPDAAWRAITGTSNTIDSMQVFDGAGNEIAFYGDTRGRVSFSRISDASEGIMASESTKEFSATRHLRRQSAGNEVFSIVLTSLRPADFNAKAAKLTDSSDTFAQIESFLPIFRITLIVFYGFFSLPLLLISLLISFLLSEQVIQPIVSLEEATRKVADGDFSYRILGRTGQELATLVESFNMMMTELERSRYKLLQTEKISAWQEIARRMAHEIKNPLTPIKLSAQRILYRFHENREDFDRILEPAVESIIEEVENLNNLLDEFSTFSRLPAPQIAEENLYSLINEVVAMYADSFPRVHVSLDDVDRQTVLPVDRGQMRQVFSNLLKNAFEAIVDSGNVVVRTDLVRKQNKRYCRIQVKDSGVGIDPDFHGQVFNPYFTTKPDGTGLGLSIVERIIFDHKGQIWFETEKGAGTTFIIDLPLEQEN